MPRDSVPPHYLDLLQHPQSGSWDEASIPLAQRGVRLSWLCDLVESITWYANEPVRKAAEEYEKYLSHERAARGFDHIPWPDYVAPPPNPVAYTTRDLVEQYILPLTEKRRVPLYALAPESARGVPGQFISHRWDSHIFVQAYKLGTLAAVGPGIAGIKEEFVWMDIACYNQHTFENVAEDMKSVIGSIGKVAFAVTPIPLLDRIWCLWELVCAASIGDDRFQFCVAPSFRTEINIIVNEFYKSFTSVEQAKATKREDKQAILGAINRHFGSTAKADTFIKDLMRRGMAHWWFGLRPEDSEREVEPE